MKRKGGIGEGERKKEILVGEKENGRRSFELGRSRMEERDSGWGWVGLSNLSLYQALPLSRRMFFIFTFETLWLYDFE